MNRLLKIIGLKEEQFPTAIPVCRISWDRIPDPTQEERHVMKIPTIATRISAQNFLAWLILKKLIYPRLPLNGPSSLLTRERCLEIYPIPSDFRKERSD